MAATRKAESATAARAAPTPSSSPTGSRWNACTRVAQTLVATGWAAAAAAGGRGSRRRAGGGSSGCAATPGRCPKPGACMEGIGGFQAPHIGVDDSFAVAGLVGRGQAPSGRVDRNDIVSEWQSKCRRWPGLRCGSVAGGSGSDCFVTIPMCVATGAGGKVVAPVCLSFRPVFKPARSLLASIIKIKNVDSAGGCIYSASKRCPPPPLCPGHHIICFLVSGRFAFVSPPSINKIAQAST